MKWASRGSFMKKAKVEKSGAKRKIGRVRSSARACVGVMCAALLLVGAMPTASGAFGEDAPEGTGAPEATETVPCVLAAGNPTKEGPAPSPPSMQERRKTLRTGPKRPPCPTGIQMRRATRSPEGTRRMTSRSPAWELRRIPAPSRTALALRRRYPFPQRLKRGPVGCAPGGYRPCRVQLEIRGYRRYQHLQYSRIRQGDHVGNRTSAG